MDEFRRIQMRMGVSTSVKPRSRFPRMRSTEETPDRRSRSQTLDPEDFSDVFGGPPRNVLRRQLSGASEFYRPSLSCSSFYEDIFRISETVGAPAPIRSGGSSSSRNLPEFSIPPWSRRERSVDAFYGDVFGKEDELRMSRSRSVSKSNCSSMLSSDDMSSFRPAIPNDDVAFSVLTSNLRPIHVPSPRWNSTASIPEQHLRQQRQVFPAFSSNDPNSHFNHQFTRKVPSPETIISLDPNSYGSFKVSMYDHEPNSPSSSVVSSLCQDIVQPKTENMTNEEPLQEVEQDSDDDEVMSSYVIEINSDHREGTKEAFGIDEAIAWAKEKFQSVSRKEEDEKNHTPIPKGSPITNELSDAKIISYKNLSSPERELELLDVNIKEWSVGKETNIRLLLSTLHHILWANSGWQEIPITTLMEYSHVKKAYQKARLCLHPDKVQQRGSTFTQKYVAEKTFAILQEAWATFICEDV